MGGYCWPLLVPGWERVFILCLNEHAFSLSPAMTVQKFVSICEMSRLNLFCSALGLHGKGLHPSPTAASSPQDSLGVSWNHNKVTKGMILLRGEPGNRFSILFFLHHSDPGGEKRRGKWWKQEKVSFPLSLSHGGAYTELGSWLAHGARRSRNPSGPLSASRSGKEGLLRSPL